MMFSSFEVFHVFLVSPLGLSACQSCAAVHPMGGAAGDRTAPTSIVKATVSKRRAPIENIGSGCLLTY
jgi:hypothetical protein